VLEKPAARGLQPPALQPHLVPIPGCSQSDSCLLRLSYSPRSLNVCYFHGAFETDAAVQLVLEHLTGGQLWERCVWLLQQGKHLRILWCWAGRRAAVGVMGVLASSRNSLDVLVECAVQGAARYLQRACGGAHHSGRGAYCGTGAGAAALLLQCCCC